MRSSTIMRSALFSLALVIAPATGFGSAAVATATTPPLSISLGCYSNPERTTIHNNRPYTITIRTVGSTYRARSNEPFSVYYRLAAGRSITYQTGYAAYSHVLTHQYIYNNNGLDGARVTSSAGTFSRHC